MSTASGSSVAPGSGPTGSGGSSGSSGAGISDLDPVFVRALRLLHSNSKDALHQLKALLDDSIRGRKGGSGAGGHAGGPVQPMRDEQKRNFETLKRDLSELVDSGSSKRPRLHQSPARLNKSHTPSPTPPSSVTVAPAVERLSGGESGGEEVDLDLEGLNDLICCVCKNWNQVKGNNLMECHTCQNLYHQECHSPPISDEEAGIRDSFGIVPNARPRAPLPKFNPSPRPPRRRPQRVVIRKGLREATSLSSATRNKSNPLQHQAEWQLWLLLTKDPLERPPPAPLLLFPSHRAMLPAQAADLRPES